MTRQGSTQSAIVRAARRVAIACALTAAAAAQIATVDARPPPERWQEESTTCKGRQSPDKNAALAREALNRGDAEIAAQNPRLDVATSFWRQAILEGECTGAQAAIIARKRLQMYTLTTWTTPESLAALTPQELGGEIVNVKAIQQALWALGYYKGPPDAQLSPRTRDALHKFQNDMAFDETDALVPRQIVYLIGNGAETARDALTQTTLAFMFVKGVGVPENMNFAAAWLRKAASHNANATFYMAVLSGTGSAPGHEHQCFERNIPYADQYLKEAARQGHAGAQYLVKKYAPPAGQAYPWTAMEGDKVVSEALDLFGGKCTARRSSAPRIPTPKPAP